MSWRTSVGKKDATRRVLELKAEAVSYVVSKPADMEGRAHSSDYIQLCAGDKQLLLASLSHIQRVVSDIIAALMGSHRTAQTQAA